MYPAAHQVPDMSASALREANQVHRQDPSRPPRQISPRSSADGRPRAQPITTLQRPDARLLTGAVLPSPRPTSLTGQTLPDAAPGERTRITL